MLIDPTAPLAKRSDRAFCSMPTKTISLKRLAVAVMFFGGVRIRRWAIKVAKP
jgi:hypothetical protein